MGTRSMDPIFSVIIPAFNRARVLGDALDSVFVQGIPEVQVIVVDDGSTDDTGSVVAAYGRGVEYIHQKKSGPAGARNTGLKRARGRFISFLDSDDIWLPGKMNAELAIFESNPAAEAIISDSERWLESELVCRSWFRDLGLIVGQQPVPLPPNPPLWARNKICATCCLTLKREALERLGEAPFDTSFPTHQDWDFVIRVIHSCNVIVLPHKMAIIRRFDDGTRIGRPLPGTLYPPAVKRVMAYRRYRMFEKAQRLSGWPEGVAPHIEAALTDAAREVADNLDGWRRSELARLVLKELRRGAFASAVVVMASGLAPSRLRALLF